MAKRTAERHVVATASDLPSGGRKVVTVKGHEIGVFHVGDGYYALLNRCPHRAGPLCKGRLRPLVISTGGTHLGHERESEILKCPWHQWEFDIKTGQALYDEKLRVRTYPVVLEGEEVVLYL